MDNDNTFEAIKNSRIFTCTIYSLQNSFISTKHAHEILFVAKVTARTGRTTNATVYFAIYGHRRAKPTDENSTVNEVVSGPLRTVEY